MGWILDLFKGLNLAPELVTKLNDIEAELSVLQSDNVALKLEVENLQKQIADKKREKQELEQENQQLRKTKELTHGDLVEENTELEQVQNYINGFVIDAETGDRLQRAKITMQEQSSRQEYYTYSDREGCFYFPLPFGWYTVTISLSGYLPVAGACLIRKEESSFIDYGKMEKAPPTIQIA